MDLGTSSVRNGGHDSGTGGYDWEPVNSDTLYDKYLVASYITHRNASTKSIGRCIRDLLVPVGM